MKITTKWLLRTAVIAIAGWLAWSYFSSISSADPDYVFRSNGRIEAVEISISAKAPGRVIELAVHEGEFVTQGQLLARLDSAAQEALLHQAQAQLRQAESAVAAALSQVKLRESERAAAQAVLAQRRAELGLAESRYNRTQQLAAQGSMSQQDLDNANAALLGAEAAIAATQAQVEAADAAIEAAKTAVTGAASSVDAAQALLDRLKIELTDNELRAPRDGRIQFIIARPGEVVGAGGRVMNVVVLRDVYMTFFLPTAVVGKLALGSEARIIVDAAPNYVIPATISYIADEAQFTPKTVETQLEREKLMFRVRAQISPALLDKYLDQVKTGLPGVVYVRTDASVPWPEHLQPSGS